MNQLTIKDIMTMGILTAIYVVIVGLITTLAFVFIPGISLIWATGVTAFFAAVIYFLIVVRVPKRGAILTLSLAMGIILGLTGHMLISITFYAIVGILAEIVVAKLGYKNYTAQTIGYVLFSLPLIGPIIPVWFLTDSYVVHLQQRNKDAAYISQMMSYSDMTSFVLCIICTIVGALAGAILAKKLLAKHFKRAGVIN